MSRWRNFCITELADFCNAQRIPLSAMERAHKKGNFPYYGASGIVDYIDNYIFDGSYILISEDGENLNSRKTPIAFEATGKFWVNNHAHVLKAKKPHLTALIIQYFSQLDLSPYLTGAAQPKLNKASLNLIPLYLPIDESEQKAIASILSSLKDKIDLLHCQNKTLESMAETLFRQWFILDSTGVSVSIDQIIDFNPKRTLIKSQDATYLDMAGLSTVNFRANGYYRRPFSSGTKFTKRDTLLARITPCLENGKAAYIDFLDDNETGWGSTEFIVMRPKKEIHPFISYIMCRNPDFKEYAESCMEGSSGRQRVNLDHLKKFNVNLPTEASLRIINELLDSFESKLINNSKQIDSLEKLRDTLLPKLMSGEVRVQYAEEAIASVA
ncbi:restriction endonuclease subunit S [Salmonella enterica]|nr:MULTISPECIES: restriction endonuclease subunit S [Enterobacteriaceae]EAP9726980.1 restriction endonuclease subunit S [Salmonella enterica]EBW5589585.1 restriction endonuclease subunit S [Salmonella enterica subsp. enterica serovar Brandenburg]ECB6317407.1 restriction endonuclease subunit S [Salmonella enterica subsp. enterica serovar Panama]EDT8992942.1 restriction endonuclease subunit S [Salmonella enterica subsp. enterica serovar Pomona]EDW5333184.1 restriction endonuclease subunit S [Sal